MLFHKPLHSIKSHHERKKIVKSHFNHLITFIPKPIVEIHEIKKSQEPKPNVPTPHHVLFEFTKAENILEPKSESEPEPKPEKNSPLEKDNMVEYVVDDYIDMGNIYNPEFEKSDYNPMYFSLRHYISSK